MENITDVIIVLLGICLGIILLGIMIIKFISSVYVPFADKRDYICMEIARSYGNTRIHWEYELRRLYLRQIPLIGKRLAEANKKSEVKKREKSNSL